MSSGASRPNPGREPCFGQRGLQFGPGGRLSTPPRQGVHAQAPSGSRWMDFRAGASAEGEGSAGSVPEPQDSQGRKWVETPQIGLDVSCQPLPPSLLSGACSLTDFFYSTGLYFALCHVCQRDGQSLGGWCGDPVLSAQCQDASCLSYLLCTQSGLGRQLALNMCAIIIYVWSQAPQVQGLCV